MTFEKLLCGAQRLPAYGGAIFGADYIMIPAGVFKQQKKDKYFFQAGWHYGFFFLPNESKPWPAL
ncbi:hypothetical protein [Caproiciproducens sp. LBM24188]